MTSSVLVLNQDYSPLSLCSAERAFLLIYLRKAELINEVDELSLRSVSKSYPFPSVIRIFSYINIPYRGVVLSRHNVFKRDMNECQYCGSRQNLTLDHLIPKSKGGKSSWMNLVTACKPCNSKKGDFTPEEVGLKLRRKPKKPSYLTFLRNLNGNARQDWLQYLEPKMYA
ncbi:MAG: HNH endonuclease [Cyclobacteriaceae bacterium]|nr:HNH endonuclease [Cyclobacteriaceae bacterium HetDA_MAG_MS6]